MHGPLAMHFYNALPTRVRRFLCVLAMLSTESSASGGDLPVALSAKAGIDSERVPASAAAGPFHGDGNFSGGGSYAFSWP
mmetsp:Transcript_56426/g.104450  ORF Transcript_56426/g.104450 Transcript_56426/m.104450 type:complete len:80 (-) Transcript_56426:1993-2232(-)